MSVGPVVFIGMESSGALRERFQRRGFFTVSCDLLEAEDGSRYPEVLHGRELGGHVVGDVFECLEWLRSINRWPDLAVFHPTCTYMTGSAEWAYKDPDYVRYPGVGYHQRLKEGTLFGADRRAAREDAVAEVVRIQHLPIRRKVVENPVGVLSTRIRRPSQIFQPYEHGDDASKKTCCWYFDEQGDEAEDMRVPVDPDQRVPGRVVNGRERWANQTDSGQNKLGAGTPDRWRERSRTYPGIADAWADAWSKLLDASHQHR